MDCSFALTPKPGGVRTKEGVFKERKILKTM